MMNRHHIIEIVRHPHLLNEQTLSDIRIILDEYPFFQAARMLWINNLHILDHIRYNNELKLAAIHIPDRAKLYELLHSESEKTLFETSLVTEIAQQNEVVSLNGESTGEDVITKCRPMDKPMAKAVVSDYFDVDDTIDTFLGDKLDFSKLHHKKEEELKPVFPLVEDNMVLPSADLLDYERSDSNFFSLTDSETEINRDEFRSFSAWLKVLRQQPVPKIKDSIVNPPVTAKGEKRNLIDDFLQKGTKSRIRIVGDAAKVGENEDFSLKSLQENEDLMTETLANIYIGQKQFSKAIEIFERLRLKYPEKSIYFARRIKELEEQISNQ